MNRFGLLLFHLCRRNAIFGGYLKGQPAVLDAFGHVRVVAIRCVVRKSHDDHGAVAIDLFGTSTLPYLFKKILGWKTNECFIHSSWAPRLLGVVKSECRHG